MSGESEALPTASSGLATQSADSASVVKEALQLSLAEAEITRESAPPGLDTALKDLNADPSSDQVTILFLKTGVKVWYTYFRASSRDNRIGSSAATLPASTLHRIATDISTTVPHQSVTDRIKRTFEVSRRGKSRTGKSLRWRRIPALLLPRLILQKYYKTFLNRSNQTFHQIYPIFQPNLSTPLTRSTVDNQRRRPPPQMRITSIVPPNVSAPITNNTADNLSPTTRPQ